MPCLLTIPRAPEGGGAAAPRAKITMIQISIEGDDNPLPGKGPQNYIHSKVNFGDVVGGKWVSQKALKPLKWMIDHADYVAAIAEVTTAGEGHNIYAGIKRFLWAYAQAQDATLAGTIE